MTEEDMELERESVNLTVHVVRSRPKDKKDYYPFDTPEEAIVALAQRKWVAIGPGGFNTAILNLDMPEELFHTINDILLAYQMGIAAQQLHRQYCEEIEKEAPESMQAEKD